MRYQADKDSVPEAGVTFLLSMSGYDVRLEAPTAQSGCRPSTQDFDDDGVLDYDELYTHETDPAAADTDGDGLSDGDELLQHNTDPLATDSDNDGLDDLDEVTQGTDPNSTDSDGDGLSDCAEVLTHNTDPTRQDTDADGLSDPDELGRLGSASAPVEPAHQGLDRAVYSEGIGVEGDVGLSVERRPSGQDGPQLGECVGPATHGAQVALGANAGEVGLR